MRQCSKPRCSNTATAILGYSYADREAVLEDAPPGAISPHVYAFCPACADSLTPPRGWVVQDRRSRPPLFIDLEPALMGAQRSDN